ncbi:flagellar motor switch protein FliN [bacterium E08(2017)]|nr:flagellar motor switch protein FliN [bacterium E08(2017)]
MADKENPEEITDVDASSEGKVEVATAELPQIDESRGVEAAAGSEDMNLKMILDIPVDVRVELGNTNISIKDILKMGAGSVVELDREAGSPADIVVNGKLIGQGDVVVINDNFGIRITKLVDPEERIESL